jgi:hypothetical protein
MVNILIARAPTTLLLNPENTNKSDSSMLDNLKM